SCRDVFGLKPVQHSSCSVSSDACAHTTGRGSLFLHPGALSGPRKLACHRGLSSLMKKLVAPPESMLPSITGNRLLLLQNTTPMMWAGARLRNALTPILNAVACSSVPLSRSCIDIN